MKYLSIFFLFFAVLQTSYAQTPSHLKYINSFKEDQSKKVLNAGDIVQINNRMTKEEALKFVYYGDTAKLFCYQKIFNMETEKVEGISRELYLPDKCMRLDMGNYFLIAYSSYKCENPNEILKVFLTLTIVNKKYQLCDSLLIYKGSDYGPDITSLINPNNGKVFLYGYVKNQSTRQAIILKVNPDSLKFKMLVENDNFNGSIDYLTQTLDILGWTETFMN